MTVNHFNQVIFVGTVLPESVERKLSKSGNPVLKFRIRMVDKPFKDKNGKVLDDTTEVDVWYYRKANEMSLNGGETIMMSGRLVARNKTFVIAKHISTLTGEGNAVADMDNIGNLLPE